MLTFTCHTIEFINCNHPNRPVFPITMENPISALTFRCTNFRALRQSLLVHKKGIWCIILSHLQFKSTKSYISLDGQKFYSSEIHFQNEFLILKWNSESKIFQNLKHFQKQLLYRGDTIYSWARNKWETFWFSKNLCKSIQWKTAPMLLLSNGSIRFKEWSSTFSRLHMIKAPKLHRLSC